MFLVKEREWVQLTRTSCDLPLWKEWYHLMIKEWTFIAFIFSSKTWGWAQINKEHSCICFWLFEMFENKTAGPHLSLYVNWNESSASLTSSYNFSDHKSFKTIHDSWSVIKKIFRANQSTIPLFFELCTAPRLLLLVENFLQLQKQLMLVWTQLIQLFFQLWYLQIKTVKQSDLGMCS